MNRQKPAVQLHDVGKRFPLYGSPLRQMLGYLGVGTRGVRHKQAVDGVNLTIAHGEKIGVVGHNGSGKTTLLRLITGFTRPTSGRVEVDGTIQALMQRGYGFNDALSGLENIRNALVYNGLPAAMLAEAEAGQDLLAGYAGAPGVRGRHGDPSGRARDRRGPGGR